jgi:hypothetical protein
MKFDQLRASLSPDEQIALDELAAIIHENGNHSQWWPKPEGGNKMRSYDRMAYAEAQLCAVEQWERENEPQPELWRAA